MFKKKLVLCIVSLLLMAIAFGCSNDSSESTGSNGSTDNGETANDSTKEVETVELDFVYTGDPAFRQAMTAVIDSFSEEYPNIIVKGESATDGSYSEYLRTKDATGEFPDIFEVMDVQEYVDSGKVAELPEELASLVRNPVTIEGKSYVLPRDSNALGYIYNKAFFEEHGLNEEPATYQEFIDVMEQVKNLDETPIAVGGQDVWHMGFWINHFLINNIYADNPSWNAEMNAGEASWADEGPKKAMTQLVDLFNSGLVSENWISTPDNQLAALVASGKAIGFFSGPWMFTQLKEANPDFEIGFMPVPDEEGNINLFTGGTATGFTISKELENDPVKMEAAKTFYNYFFSKDVYSGYLKTMGTLPSTVESITYEASPEQEKLIETYNNADVTSPPINERVGENQIPSSFRDWYYKTVQEWILGEKDLEAELPKVDAEWKKLQDQR
jgi:raffinose/stachyose/melibiose transport system substrate-binding protein